MQSKTCTKCDKSFPTTLEFFYKNNGGKFGLTPRCKSCVNEDNKASALRLKTLDPEHVRQRDNAKSKRYYENNTGKARECSRKSAARARKDPERYKKIQARKRAGGAGLTVEQIEEIRLKQNNLCAICEDPNPTDLDHCHKSGVVRWLLCRHCNRGLGAFRDRPDLMRKAAEMLEQICSDKRE